MWSLVGKLRFHMPCGMAKYIYIYIYIHVNTHTQSHTHSHTHTPSHCCCSAGQLCPSACNPMDHSMLGLPLPHHLPELTQTHVHWVDDAIQPSHPFLYPSPAFSLSQHQGLFKWVRSLHQVAKGLEIQLQHQAFQWVFRVDFLWNWLVWSPCCPRDSQESSPTPQFKSINSLAFNFLYSRALTSIDDYWENHSFDYTDLCWQSNVSAF